MFLSRTVTYKQKELEAELARIQKRFDAYERFEDDVRDVMDFIPKDQHYLALNAALDRLHSEA